MWSLTQELRALTGAPDVVGVLQCLGVPVSNATDEGVSIRVLEQWTRGGSETYILHFAVVGNAGCDIRFVMKALVPPPGGGSIADALRANQDRRDLLQLNGIRVPIRYAAGSGCVVEEYIQFGLWEFLEDLPPASASVARLCDGLVSYAVVLDQLGFAPIDPFVDLRTDGQDVIPVDFGQDLGPAAVALAHSRTRWLEDVLFYVPRRHKKRLQPALAAAAERYLFDR